MMTWIEFPLPHEANGYAKPKTKKSPERKITDIDRKRTRNRKENESRQLIYMQRRRRDRVNLPAIPSTWIFQVKHDIVAK